MGYSRIRLQREFTSALRTVVRSLHDGRLAIDDAPAGQALRPLAVGRRNGLQIAGVGQRGRAVPPRARREGARNAIATGPGQLPGAGRQARRAWERSALTMATGTRKASMARLPSSAAAKVVRWAAIRG